MPGDDFASLHAAFGDLPGGGAQDGGALEREPAVAHVGGGLTHGGGLLGELVSSGGGRRVAFLFGGERYGGVLTRSSRACSLVFRANGLALAPRAPGRCRLSGADPPGIRMAASVPGAAPEGGSCRARRKPAPATRERSGKAGVHGIKAHERLPAATIVLVHVHGDDLAAHLRHDAQHIAGDYRASSVLLKSQK